MSVVLVMASQAPGITIRIPTDSLRVGAKGTQHYLSIFVDSLAPADSIASIQVKIVCDTGRIRAASISTTNTISSGPYDCSGTYVTGGYKVSVIAADGISVITGSGILIYVVFQILDDTAEFTRIGFDSTYTEVAKYVGPNIVRAKVTTVPGGIVFVPTAQFVVVSDSIRFWRDTIIRVPVILKRVRGDNVKSLSVRLRSANRRFVFADLDTAGTLIGLIAREGWWLSTISDSGKTVTISAERSTALGVLPDSSVVIYLKVLVHDTVSFQNRVMIDSLVVNGFAERFSVVGQDGEFAVKYLRHVSVQQSDILLLKEMTVYPNPAHSGATVEGMPDGEEIRALEVLDVYGRSILGWQEMRGGSAAIVTERLPAGFYMVRLRTTAGTRTARLAVVH